MEETNNENTPWYAEAAGMIAGLSASYTMSNLMRNNTVSPSGKIASIAITIGISVIGGMIGGLCEKYVSSEVSKLSQALKDAAHVFKAVKNKDADNGR